MCMVKALECVKVIFSSASSIQYDDFKIKGDLN